MANPLFAACSNPFAAVAIPLVTGVSSGFSTRKVAQGQWYKNLRSPPGRRPGPVFAIVWPTLYISMGYASHIAANALASDILTSQARNDLRLGLSLYYLQLGLNCLWTPLFFGKRKIGLALLDSICLAGTTLYMTKLFDGATKGRTTWFLLPYCAWLSFATYLNGGIWLLNKRTATP